MKKYILPLAGGLLFFWLGAVMPGTCRAGFATFESMVVNVNPSTGTYCQSISTSSYTLVPPATLGNLPSRNGIVVLVPPSNTANMGGVIVKGTNGKSVQPSGITSYNYLFVKGNPDRALSIGDDMFLYLISLNTSAENVCWQEYQQR